MIMPIYVLIFTCVLSIVSSGVSIKAPVNIFKSFDIRRFFRHKFIFNILPPKVPGGLGEGYSPPKKTPLIPIVTRNASSVVDTEDLPKEHFSSNTKKPTKTLNDLWIENTRNSKGLLVFLLPTIFNQIALLHTISIFLIDRLAQYLQPSIFLLACTLMHPNGIRFIRKVLWGSISLGAVFMFKDTIAAGANWAPLLSPSNESYAVVTGASSGIG